MKVDVSSGELVDKLTILEIKLERMANPAQRANVAREHALLSEAFDSHCGDRIAATRAELKAVNAELWRIEDDIREHERRGDFGPSFIALARSIYRNNDRRAALKRRINEVLGSELIEEKSYEPY